jgi:hypothetical protein
MHDLLDHTNCWQRNKMTGKSEKREIDINCGQFTCHKKVGLMDTKIAKQDIPLSSP